MNYDNWKATDPVLERAGAIEEAVDNQVEAIGDIWQSWGLTLVIDTPDLGDDEWRDQVHDMFLDGLDGPRSPEWIAEVLMETYIEQVEEPGPYTMTVKHYREIRGARRSAWRVTHRQRQRRIADNATDKR